MFISYDSTKGKFGNGDFFFIFGHYKELKG